MAMASLRERDALGRAALTTRCSQETWHDRFFECGLVLPESGSASPEELSSAVLELDFKGGRAAVYVRGQKVQDMDRLCISSVITDAQFALQTVVRINQSILGSRTLLLYSPSPGHRAIVSESLRSLQRGGAPPFEKDTENSPPSCSVGFRVSKADGVLTTRGIRRAPVVVRTRHGRLGDSLTVYENPDDTVPTYVLHTPSAILAATRHPNRVLLRSPLGGPSFFLWFSSPRDRNVWLDTTRAAARVLHAAMFESHAPERHVVDSSGASSEVSLVSSATAQKATMIRSADSGRTHRASEAGTLTTTSVSPNTVNDEKDTIVSGRGDSRSPPKQLRSGSQADATKEPQIDCIDAVVAKKLRRGDITLDEYRHIQAIRRKADLDERSRVGRLLRRPDRVPSSAVRIRIGRYELPRAAADASGSVSTRREPEAMTSLRADLETVRSWGRQEKRRADALEEQLRRYHSNHIREMTSLGHMVLRQGCTFLKHMSRHRPHHRFVFLSSDLAAIVWQDRSSHRRAVRGRKSVLVHDIISVQTGCRTRAFRTKWSKETDPTRCFSLVTRRRTLDLEADTTETAALWSVLLKQCLLKPSPQQKNSGRSNATRETLPIEDLTAFSVDQDHSETAPGGTAALVIESKPSSASQSPTLSRNPSLVAIDLQRRAHEAKSAPPTHCSTHHAPTQGVGGSVKVPKHISRVAIRPLQHRGKSEKRRQSISSPRHSMRRPSGLCQSRRSSVSEHRPAWVLEKV